MARKSEAENNAFMRDRAGAHQTRAESQGTKDEYQLKCIVRTVSIPRRFWVCRIYIYVMYVDIWIDVM